MGVSYSSFETPNLLIFPSGLNKNFGFIWIVINMIKRYNIIILVSIAYIMYENIFFLIFI